jgi:parallel beta-helix repeat protein
MYHLFRRSLLNKRRFLLVIMLFLSLATIGSAKDGSIPITLADIPLTITTPGNFYLTSDISVPADLTAITITASGVNLDLNGFFLSGLIRAEEDCMDGVFPNASVGVKVMAAPRVKIYNGTIQGFGIGITVQDSSGTALDRLAVIGNCFSGIHIQSSTRTQLENSTIAGNFDHGIFSTGSTRLRMFGLTINQNRHGIIVDQSFEPLMKGNHVLDNFVLGIGISCGIGGKVRYNTVSGNSDGISVGCGEVPMKGILIDGNLVTGNQTGIGLTNVTDSTVRGNTLLDNYRYGILVGTDSIVNRLERNNVTNSGIDLYDGNLPSCLNTWKNNSFNSDNEGDGPDAGCIQ